MNVGAILKAVELFLEVGATVVEAVRNKGDAAGDLKLKDLPGWNKWKTEAISPNYDAVITELEKRRKERAGG